MSETMKLFFIWPRLRHDLTRRVRDQAPKTFHHAIQIAQIIEASSLPDITNFSPATIPLQRQTENTPIPMDIDVQNAQTTMRRQLPERDAQGRPRCFHCNIYGHVRRRCRKLKLQQPQTRTSQYQNAQIELADTASLAELPGNV